MQAGRKLADLHINYETIEPWPLKEIGNSENPGRVEKLRYDKKGKVEDKSTIIYNERLALTGIPAEAHRYMLNGKPALGWLLDRYRVTTDKASGIVNDPNEYSSDPRYIVDLIKRVTRVSIETMQIVDALPPLNELPQPTYWPDAWKVY
jgi:predicted helicase